MTNQDALKREIDQKVVAAWNHAAVELGIRVTAPFTIVSENGGVESYEALIPDFGGPNGTVTGIIHRDGTELREWAGYYASNLSDSYRKYDRKLFQETLDDWQWTGNPDQKPSWYTGKPWT